MSNSMILNLFQIQESKNVLPVKTYNRTKTHDTIYMNIIEDTQE